MALHRLVIVDDNTMFLNALKEWLAHIPSLVVVGDTQDGQQAGHLCQRLKPDVLLLGLTVAGAAPAEIVRVVRAQSPETHIIVLATHVGAVRWPDIADQVDGYLVKSDAPATICRAIERVSQGASCFRQPIIQPPVSVLDNISGSDPLAEVGAILPEQITKQVVTND